MKREPVFGLTVANEILSKARGLPSQRMVVCTVQCVTDSVYVENASSGDDMKPSVIAE